MTTDNRNPRTGNTSLTIGLALVAGTGFFAMLIALAIGVIEGTAADGEFIGVLFAAGLVTFLVGAATWAFSVRPWENFDDINVPQYHGHHESHDHHEEETEH